MSACDKHNENPVVGSNTCPGCEVESLREEVDRLVSIIFERETKRIAESLGKLDSQKYIDELVALGIQQDKEEIASIKDENGDLKFALQLIMAEGGTAGAIAYQALKELEQ